ncbi:hypothetical protein RB595_002624 [Gaeumannomyces hyphopodioides]
MSFLDEYRTGKTDVLKLVSAEAAHTKTHITTTTMRSGKEVSDHITERLGRLETQLRSDVGLVVRSAAQRDDQAGLVAKRERLLRSFKFENMNERRNRVTPSHSGTFSWVLQDGSDSDRSSDVAGTWGQDANTRDMSRADISWDRFSDWLRSTAPAYWISGKPGSGKTTLMKCLLSHSLTRTFLNLWEPDVVLVSHFFWRPGKEMQQSIKGMLCSLLHQLLSEETEFTNQLLQGTKFAAALSKDHETDWSSEELLAAFHEVLSHYPKPIAIFLDGLDEVLPRDGTLRLLGVIEELRQLDPQTQKFKMCLGSRREPLLLRKLCSIPQLRLEQVNFSDLRKYGMDNINVPPDYHNIILCHDWEKYDWEKYDVSSFFWGKIPPGCDDFRDWLVSELLDKAEGVFLWLCLTVKEVTKAIHQGETVEDLTHRIRKLPTDLEDLYADMWARIDTESAPIRNRAGSYFQLALANRPNRDIFAFMVATTPAISARLFAFETAGILPADSLTRACEATKRDIEVACAGLLVCASSLDTPKADKLEQAIWKSRFVPWYGEEYDTLIPYMKSDVFFLHRTARDFLVDTEVGQRILACGTFPGDLPYYKRIESSMATSLFMRQSSVWVSGYPGHSYSVLHAIYRRREDGHGNLDSICATQQRLLRFCEQLFNTGHIEFNPIVPQHCFHLAQQNGRSWPMTSQAIVRRQHEFLLQWAQIPFLRDETWCEILRGVTSRNVDNDTASELLVYACSFHFYRGLCYGFRLSAIKNLLAFGASLAWNGSCRLALSRYEVAGYTTAFRELILSIWTALYTCDNEENWEELLQLIPLFLSSGCSLGEEVYIQVRLHDGNNATVTGRLPGFEIPRILRFSPIFENTTLIIAYPAAALLARAFRFRKLEDSAKYDWLIQREEMRRWGLENGQLIAIAYLGFNNGRPYSIFETPNVYPMPPGGKLDKDLARLLEMVERKLRDYRPEEKMEEEIPLDVQQGVFRAVKQMRSEDALAVVRIRRFRERVGICTPFEEWPEQKTEPLWDEEWDEDGVGIRPRKDMEELLKNEWGAEGGGERSEHGVV